MGVMAVPRLEVNNVVIDYTTRLPGGRSRNLRAVDGVSFSIPKGTTFGLVGESGSGKSSLARAIVGLVAMSEGSVALDGKAIDASKPGKYASRIQMIFQDPLSSLNPKSTVFKAIRIPLLLHGICAPDETRSRSTELLTAVGLDESFLDRVPRELSGGQRQRVGIARALAVEPEILICDEPVSALDVSIQAEVLQLLQALQTERGLTYLFIAHDLAVVAGVSDQIGVMYLGSLAEVGSAGRIVRQPRHPYSRALLSAQPVPDPLVERSRDRIVLHGDPPSPYEKQLGCPFQSRCPLSKQLDSPRICIEERPRLIDVHQSQAVACHFVDGDLAGTDAVLEPNRNHQTKEK